MKRIKFAVLLLAAVLLMTLFTAAPASAYSSGDPSDPSQMLSGPYLEIERRFKAEIENIAYGLRTTTCIDIDYSDLSSIYGIDYYDVAAHLPEITRVLNRDCSYALYWWTGTCDYTHVGDATISLDFVVADDYGTSTPHTLDTAKVGRALTAIDNANAIIARYEGCSDREKLRAYYNEIRALCDYDYDAYYASMDGQTPATYGADPWNMINVFDGDESTKAICTGFSKAFQYLCDKSSFEGSVRCSMVSGNMGGEHTWNVLRFNGTNYLMDVTKGYFLYRAVSGSVTEGYLFENGRNYSYDVSTTQSFIPAALEIAPLDWTLTDGVLNYTPSDELDYRFSSSAFASMGVTRVEFNPGATVLGSSFFNGCTAIESVALPNTLRVIGDYAFFNCSGLKFISVPETLTDVGYESFYGCSSLITVSIPEGPVELQDYTFYGCSSLLDISIPVSMKTIGYAAFNKCSSLADVFYAGTRSRWGGISIGVGNNPLTNAELHCGQIPAPVLTEAFNSATGVRVSWTPVEDAVKYQLLRINITKGEPGWSVVGETTDCSLIDTTVASASRYTFSVRGVEANGDEGYCDEIGRTCTYIAKADITELKAVSNGVSITWSKPAGAKNFRVMRRVDGSSAWKVLAVVEGTSYTDTTAATGVKYWYTVRGVSMDNTVLINSYNGTGWSIKRLSTPVLTEAFNSATGVRVSWNPVAGATKYRLLRKNVTKGDVAWSAIGETTAATLIDTSAASASRYTYTVECVDSNNRTCSARNETGRTCTYIAMSRITTIGSVTNGVKLVWSQPAGAKNFRVFRKTDGGSWTALKDVLGTSYVDTTAVKGVKYWYTVRAVTMAGDMYINSYNATGWSVTRK